ncbi:MAG: helix-hairpin-helix domain-containing protein [Phycisphaerae bacterium]|nr:helix-hairpin-helix domain-containing protein [Phycisphaerae bacterium]
MDTEQKLNILADSSKFDLACSCKLDNEPGRVRGPEGRWIYPTVLPNGQRIFLLKVLQSNECRNDCSYCPFNHNANIDRCSLGSEELAAVFVKLWHGRKVVGLFLSSGICGNADRTMAAMLKTIEILRYRYGFKGFVHLKVLPGASDNAILRAVQLATRVSVNIEVPNAKRMAILSKGKDFQNGIIRTIDRIKYYTENVPGACRGQTTQFVVGAADESDKEIVSSTAALYNDKGLDRVYFSAYQPVGDLSASEGEGSFIREHRLYQVDYLLRKYSFSKDEIIFDAEDRLSLTKDPKEAWAHQHPEFFPIDINTADREEILRVPGIGLVSVKKIIKARRARKFLYISQLQDLGVSVKKARQYLKLRDNQLVQLTLW